MTASLIERVESAAEGSREFDAEICVLFQYGGANSEGATDVRVDLEWGDDDLLFEVGNEKCCNPVPHVTTSLAAALALAEQVLPGWWWTAGKCGLTCHASVGPDRAFIAEPDLSRFDAGFHADLPNPSTPALALVASILKAHEASK